MSVVQKDARQKSAPPLATPTDLSSDAVTKVAAAVNVIVADSFALYLKTKNFHWHVSGPHFRDYHLMLDEQGDQIFAAIDPLAERARKLGRKTLHSIGEVSKVQTLSDNDQDFVEPGAMLRELMEDNKKVAHAMREAHQLCDDADDSATASLLEIYIDETEKRIWFLFEASRGQDGSGH